MGYMAPDDVRAKLTTVSAKQAFDKLNELGPHWVCDQSRDGCTAAPTIETKHEGSSVLRSLFVRRQKTFDDAVIAEYEALLAAQKAGDIIVVNAGGENKRTYVADSKNILQPCG